jgi:hypothetical protein
MPKKDLNRYSQLISAIFLKLFQEGSTEIPFNRSELNQAANELGIILPKNLGDILYSFRYRVPMPDSIKAKANEGYEWIIRPVGRALYQFVLVKQFAIIPSEILIDTKIPDATPGVIAVYALNDEQALLAKIRYNRLIDIFTGLMCYSMQNHLRTTVKNIGQVETDEIYIGIDKRGVQYIIPVQAKSKRDRIGIVQIEQDFAMCETKFPNLICHSIAAQLMGNNAIALFDFDRTQEGIRVVSEKHYKLVRPDELSVEELETYRHHSM